MSAQDSDKFWKRVVTLPSGCWEWQGARDKDGYGKARLDGVDIRAHRHAYALVNGPIAPGLKVCHRCDNPSCCNPDHLFLGTDRDNWHDAWQKGRRRLTPTQGERNASAVLTAEQVSEIRRLAAEGVSLNDIARAYPVQPAAISKIVTRRTWRHVP